MRLINWLSQRVGAVCLFADLFAVLAAYGLVPDFGRLQLAEAL